jgi:hypothetical protein
MAPEIGYRDAQAVVPLVAMSRILPSFWRESQELKRPFVPVHQSAVIVEL